MPPLVQRRNGSFRAPSRSQKRPNVQFDRALAQVASSEGQVRGDSLLNQQAQGMTYDNLSPATRQLIAENAATQSGNRNLINSADAQQFIRNGRRTTRQANTYSPSLNANNSASLTTPTTSGVTTTDPSLSLTTGATSGGATGTDQSGGLSLDLIMQYLMGSPTDSASTTADTTGLDQTQAQVDAINAQYNMQINNARDAGVRDQARTRAVGNFGGSLYSPRTDSNLQEISSQINQEVSALQSQRDAAIAATQGAASDRAQQAAYQKAMLAQQERAQKISSLLTLYQTMQQDKQAQSSRALAEAGLTGFYGGAPTLDFRQLQQSMGNDAFSQWLSQQNLGLSQEQMQLQRDQFNRPSYQFITMPDGGYGYFDPTSGSYKSLGRYSVSSGRSGGSSGGSSYGSGEAGLSPFLQNYMLGVNKLAPANETQQNYINDMGASYLNDLMNNLNYTPAEGYDSYLQDYYSSTFNPPDTNSYSSEVPGLAEALSALVNDSNY